MSELPPFPIELGASRSFRVLRAVLTVTALGFVVFGVLFALGRLQPVMPSARVLGIVIALMGLGVVVGLHGSRLTLHADRLEERSVMGLRHVVLPLASLRGGRVRSANGVSWMEFVDENDRPVGSLALIYERPDLLVTWLRERAIVDRDLETATALTTEYEQLRDDALRRGEFLPDAERTHALGQRLVQIGGLGLVAFVIARPRLSAAPHFLDIARVGWLGFGAIVAWARTRARRLSELPGVMEPLQGAQWIPTMGFLLLGVRSLHESRDWALAAGWTLLAALPVALWEHSIDARWRRSWRARASLFAAGLLFVGPFVLDANARLAFAPPFPFDAAVTTLHCTSRGSSALEWQAASDGWGGTLKVGDDVCARLSIGTHLRGERWRGALGMSFVRVYPPHAVLSP